MSESEDFLESEDKTFSALSDGDVSDPEASSSHRSSEKRYEPGRNRDIGKEKGKIKCPFPACNRSYKLLDSYRKHLGCHVAEG